MLEGLLRFGWEPILDRGHPIGLKRGEASVSLEPGGQFELSGAPLETLHQTCVEANGHLAQVREIAKSLGLGFLGLGVTPTWSREDMPIMPKQRYGIMTGLQKPLDCRSDIEAIRSRPEESGSMRCVCSRAMTSAGLRSP